MHYLRNAQQPTCRNTTCTNRKLTVKHNCEQYPEWEDNRRTHNIRCNLVVFL